MHARSWRRTSRPRLTARSSRSSSRWPVPLPRRPTRNPPRTKPTMNDTLLIGLVSISDRASGGVYEDKGIPALADWLASCITTPYRIETRLIPDERAAIEATLIELVDSARCHLVLTTGGT